MKRYLLLVPALALALASCTAGRSAATSDEVVGRATKERQEAIVLERSVWVVAEQATAGPFSYEVVNRTKVLTFSGIKHYKVAAALPPGAKLVSFEGRTMQPDGRVLDAEAGAAQIREDKLVFELPHPAVGATLEYKFKISCPAALALFYWQFQRGIPVVHSEMTVSWPKDSKLGYQVVNAPSGQPTKPDINTDEPSVAKAHWSFFDLTARPPGERRFAIVVGPKEFLTEENRDKGVGWGIGFSQVDSYMPRTAPPSGGSTGQPGSSGLGGPR